LGKIHQGKGQVTYYRSGKRVMEDYSMERYLNLLRQIEDGEGALPVRF
jgi:hypothetical protein